MVAFRAELDDREWRNFINGMLKRAENKNQLLKGAYNIFGFQDIIDHFENEEGPDGKWRQRSSNTDRTYDLIKTGRRKPPGGFRRGSFTSSNKILQLTGNMRKSILSKTVKRKSSNSVKVVSNVEYSGKHDEGDKSKNLPQRQFMWLSDGAMEKMNGFIIDELMKGI